MPAWASAAPRTRPNRRRGRLRSAPGGASGSACGTAADTVGTCPHFAAQPWCWRRRSRCWPSRRRRPASASPRPSLAPSRSSAPPTRSTRRASRSPLRATHGKVRVTVHVTAAGVGRPRDLVISVGPCTRGTTTSPLCKPTASARITATVAGTSVTRSFLVVRPPARHDALRVTLTPSGQPVPFLPERVGGGRRPRRDPAQRRRLAARPGQPVGRRHDRARRRHHGRREVQQQDVRLGRDVAAAGRRLHEDRI